MGDNGKAEDFKPTDFGELLEKALRNVINQLEDINMRLIDVESYVQNDVKNKAGAGRIISNCRDIDGR